MPGRITRRRLLSNAGKTAFALAAVGPLEAISASPTARADNGRYRDAFVRLDQFAAAHIRDVGAPGLAVTVANRSGLLRTSTYGLADVKARTPFGRDTLFEIGSISKS